MLDKNLILLFIIIVFFLGLYVYSTDGLKPVLQNMDADGFTTTDGTTDNSQIPTDCPNLLLQQGNTLLLYNTNKPLKENENPLPFFTLDDYINYLEIERKKSPESKKCPILFLQQETNTQGQDVFRMRPSPFDPQAGLPAVIIGPNTIAQQMANPIRNADANQARPPYNAGNYTGFESDGLYVGMYSTLDKIHDSTNKQPQGSDNPADENWNGVVYTQEMVNQGKYDDYNVYPPRLTTPKSY